MKKETIVNVRFIPRDEEEVPIAQIELQQFRSDMLREYWHEAISAGLKPEEASEYAIMMVN